MALSCSGGCWMLITAMTAWYLVLLLESWSWIALYNAAETEIGAATASYVIRAPELMILAKNERHLTSRTGRDEQQKKQTTRSTSVRRCSGRYVYMYEIPARFNRELLEQCDRLSIWTDMCPHVANRGLGQPLHDAELGLTVRDGWYATNQFSAEIIFHESMRRYDCLTDDPKRATAFYVPFYAGFEMSRHVGQKNLSLRDEAGKQLGNWLQDQEQWRSSGGRDHFMVAGRITWDFIRSSDSDSESWGSNLLLLPATRNMSVLLIEARPWVSNEHGIPYPTYFHPSNRLQLRRWQRKLRFSFRRRRRWLIGFIGGEKSNNVVRDRVIDQCRRSSGYCRMLDCRAGSGGDCYDPHRVMELFLSTFCLQPRGDSFTRRSTFDSMLAGCIPVFFTEHSAYSQYKWSLSEESSSYSVLIPESALNSSRSRLIESRLLSIAEKEIRQKQNKIVEMVPRLVYADPRFQGRTGFVDAFGAVIRGITEEIEQRRLLSK